MAEITNNSKVSMGLLATLAAGAWAVFGYAQGVEAKLAEERSEREKLEERVAWIIDTDYRQDEKVREDIKELEKLVIENGKGLAVVVDYVEGLKDERRKIAKRQNTKSAKG